MGDLAPPGCWPSAPCGAPGAGTRGWSRGRGDGERALGPAGVPRPSLTWRGAEHAAPPRGPRRVIGRGWRARRAAEGGPAAGGRPRTASRTRKLAAARTSLPLWNPAHSLARLHLSSGSPELFRGSPPRRGLPCDPIWPVEAGTQRFQMVSSRRQFFRLHRDNLFSVCSFLRSRKLPGPGGSRSHSKTSVYTAAGRCSTTTFPFSVAVGTREEWCLTCVIRTARQVPSGRNGTLPSTRPQALTCRSTLE